MSNTAGSNKEPVSRMNQQKGGSFEPNEPPLDPPLTKMLEYQVLLHVAISYICMLDAAIKVMLDRSVDLHIAPT